MRKKGKQNAESDARPLQVMDTITAEMPDFIATDVRLRTCGARWRLLLLPFLLPVLSRAVHYMPLEECRRGAAKRERVFMSAHEVEK